MDDDITENIYWLHAWGHSSTGYIITVLLPGKCRLYTSFLNHYYI